MAQNCTQAKNDPPGPVERIGYYIRALVSLWFLCVVFGGILFLNWEVDQFKEAHALLDEEFYDLTGPVFWASFLACIVFTALRVDIACDRHEFPHPVTVYFVFGFVVMFLTAAPGEDNIWDVVFAVALMAWISISAVLFLLVLLDQTIRLFWSRQLFFKRLLESIDKISSYGGDGIASLPKFLIGRLRRKYKNLSRMAISLLYLAPASIYVAGGFLTDPIEFAHEIGAAAIFYMFLSILLALSVLISAATAATVGWGKLPIPWPILPALVLLSIVLNVVAPASDNDFLKTRAVPMREAGRPQLSEAFEAWLEQRTDREFFERHKQPYPVYLVAAPGGGLYAGYQFARMMTSLRARCPQFADHIFALSTVSGSSVGAVAYKAAVEQEDASAAAGRPDPARCDLRVEPRFKDVASDKVDAFFSGDLFSPFFGNLLFVDTLKLIAPVAPEIRQSDRALVFEKTLASWLSESFYGGADVSMLGFATTSGATPRSPALFLNATSLIEGERVFLSPYAFKGRAAGRDMMSLAPKGTDISLSAAAVLSARFPVATPPAEVKPDDPSAPRRLVADGGFADNTGLSTLQDIMAELAEFERDRRVEFRIVAFRSYDVDGAKGADTDSTVGSASIFLAPVVALDSVRRSADQLRYNAVDDASCDSCFEFSRSRIVSYSQFWLDWMRVWESDVVSVSETGEIVPGDERLSELQAAIGEAIESGDKLSAEFFDQNREAVRAVLDDFAENGLKPVGFAARVHNLRGFLAPKLSALSDPPQSSLYFQFKYLELPFLEEKFVLAWYLSPETRESVKAQTEIMFDCFDPEISVEYGSFLEGVERQYLDKGRSTLASILELDGKAGEEAGLRDAFVTLFRMAPSKEETARLLETSRFDELAAQSRSVAWSFDEGEDDAAADTADLRPKIVREPWRWMAWHGACALGEHFEGLAATR